MPNPHILLVEDDQNLGFVIQDNLQMAGYQVMLKTDGVSAFEQFNTHQFDLCILDVMLPKLDGFSLAAQIRKKNQSVPILFLTAKSLIEDKIQGFNMGADDYVVKPFDMQELLLRVRVFLKRGNSIEPQEYYPLGTFEFHYANLQLRDPHQVQKLTQKEADILRLLCQHQGRLLKREHILKSVWGDDDYFMGRSMDVFISKLRKYLKKDPSITISNHHGVGFQLDIQH